MNTTITVDFSIRTLILSDMEINETFWKAIELLAWLVMFVIALGAAEIAVTIVLSIVDKVKRIVKA